MEASVRTSVTLIAVYVPQDTMVATVKRRSMNVPLRHVRMVPHVTTMLEDTVATVQEVSRYVHPSLWICSCGITLCSLKAQTLHRHVVLTARILNTSLKVEGCFT